MKKKWKFPYVRFICCLTLGLIMGCSSPQQNNPVDVVNQGSTDKSITSATIPNQNPVIQNLTANPTNKVKKDDKITFTIEAIDPDKDNLQYFWSADRGQLSDTKGLTVYWTPAKDGKVTSGVANISLLVSDGKGGECQSSLKIAVDETGESQVKLIVKLDCGEGSSKLVTIYSGESE